MNYFVRKDKDFLNHYKNYGTEVIGDSDIAALILVGYSSEEKSGLKVTPFEFWWRWHLCGIYRG